MAKHEGLGARALALRLLNAVLIDSAPLDDAIAKEEKTAAKLDARDVAFARAIAGATLRRLGSIDAVLQHFLSKAPPKAALTILRAGAAELLILGVAPHAAIDSANEIAQGENATRPFKGLINAVLRRVSREGAAHLAMLDATKLDTPEWLMARWAKTYGEATARAIAEAHRHEAPLDISVKADAARWATELEATLLPTGSLRRAAGGRIEDLPGYKDGAWWVQDAAAALPARLLGDVKGRRVLDLCAAPGGKTAELAAMGADVLAVESDPRRMERLRANLARLQLRAETVVADAALWRPSQPAPFVLLDAPCSATGTIRRHPDLPWAKDKTAISKSAAIQRRLLDAAVEMTAPGGTLVYAVCSLEPEEGPARIADLLSRNASMVRVPLAPGGIAGCDEFIDPAGDLRTLPSQWAERGGLDGFYACRLKRA